MDGIFLMERCTRGSADGSSQQGHPFRNDSGQVPQEVEGPTIIATCAASHPDRVFEVLL